MVVTSTLCDMLAGRAICLVLLSCFRPPTEPAALARTLVSPMYLSNKAAKVVGFEQQVDNFVGKMPRPSARGRRWRTRKTMRHSDACRISFATS